MKTSAVIGIMTLIGLGVQPAERREKAPHATVTVCLDATVRTVFAEGLASRIFAGIGVRIHWLHGSQCPTDALIVTVTVDTPASLLPGSLAYAMPGSRVRVFYDRISDPRFFPALVVPKVLGHVLAHEIGHILQGMSRHSDTGVMKATWTSADISAMTFKPLGFEPGDIRLIERGLAMRAAAAKIR